jgi:hypothetical protein
MNPTGAWRWLHGDAPDIIRIVPSRRAHPRGGSPVGLREGISRWRGRIERLRIAAVVRRRVLLGLLFAAALELLAAATGAPDRALWLIAPAALTLLGIAAGTNRRVDVVAATLLLDRQLGLDERLTTALELAPSPAAGRPLGRALIGEADAAIDQSLSRSRASDPSAGREWLCVLGGCALLIGALALGGASDSRSSAHLSARAAAAGRAAGNKTGAASAARKAAGHLKSTSAAHATPAPPHSPGAAARRSSAAPGSQSTSRAGGKGRSSVTGTATGALTQHGARSSSGASEHATTGAGKGGAATAAAGTSKAGANATGREGAAATAGKPTTTARAPAAAGATPHANGGKSAAAATRAGRTNGAAATQGSKGAGTARGRAGAPATHATTKKAANTATLPIRSGYDAAHGKGSAARTGGAGRTGAGGRESQGESAQTGEGPSSASFAFIPFADDGVASSQAPLLLDYFGPFAALSGLSW